MRKLTKLQWLEKGYFVKDGATGEEGWNNGYYNYRVTRYGDDEVYQDPAARRKWLDYRNEQARARRLAEKREREKLEKMKAERAALREEMEHWHTSWQWVNSGKVPKEDAVWKLGDVLDHGEWIKGPGFYYCHENDVVDNPTRAAELLEIYNEEDPYDGHPWW